SVTRMRSQRGVPDMPAGRGGAGTRGLLRAESSLVPSSALSFPSSIIFNIFMRSSELAITASLPDIHLDVLPILIIVHIDDERSIRFAGSIQDLNNIIYICISQTVNCMSKISQEPRSQAQRQRKP